MGKNTVSLDEMNEYVNELFAVADRDGYVVLDTGEEFLPHKGTERTRSHPEPLTEVQGELDGVAGVLVFTLQKNDAGEVVLGATDFTAK